MINGIPGAKAHPDFHYFDPRQIALQKELLHPHWASLVELLHNHTDFTVQLAEIASYIEMILDGYYDQNDLCEVLCNRMKTIRYKADSVIVDTQGNPL